METQVATPRSDAPAAAASELELTAAQWERLASRRIYFGHQSVGRNIMAGVDDLLKDAPAARLRVIDAASLADVQGPAFVHHEVGRNGDPRSKTTEFVAAFERPGAPATPAIALHKYCYVDVTASTDVDSLFADYRSRVAELRARHPELTIVHVTMPLTSVGRPNAVKDLVKKVLGRPEYPEYALNVKRNRFNAALRREYAGKEPLFDLAEIESTRSDGSRASFVRDGETVYTLVPEYTDDGGHLDREGRRRVARALLRFLADL